MATMTTCNVLLQPIKKIAAEFVVSTEHL